MVNKKFKAKTKSFYETQVELVMSNNCQKPQDILRYNMKRDILILTHNNDFTKFISEIISDYHKFNFITVDLNSLFKKSSYNTYIIIDDKYNENILEIINEFRKDVHNLGVPVTVITDNEDYEYVNNILLNCEHCLSCENAKINLKNIVNHMFDIVEFNQDLSPVTKFVNVNIIISDIINNIKNNNEISILYLDLDNFKGYNEYYGYIKGNEMINFYSNIVQETANEVDRNTIIAHIGGDDFILSSEYENIIEIAIKIGKKFNRNIENLYSIDDAKNRYIKTIDRYGNRITYPFVTISMALVTNKFNKNVSFIKFNDAITEAMKQAKSFHTGILIINKFKDDESIEKIEIN